MSLSVLQHPFALDSTKLSFAIVHMQYLILIVVLLTGIITSVWARKLTIPAAITGGVLGVILYCGSGWTGILLMAIFFILGTAATSWKRDKKQHLGIAEENKGIRKTSQVIANGGVAALVSLLACLYPQLSSLFTLMVAACFSSAAADTLSSELGSVYGRRFYNILSFKKDKRGLDGVISLEGIAFGLAGSCIIAVIYSIGFGWNIHFLWIVIAGTIGNLTDSLLGASLERRGVLQNDAVNFLNTLAAAFTSYVLFHY